VNGGRTPGRPNQVGGVLAVTKPRDEDQVRRGRGVPNQVEVRGREDRNEITTFRRCQPYRTVIQGDSAIPGSRATVATTSVITRDWDRPIEERMGLPTVQLQSEAAKPVGRKEGKVTVKPHTTRLPKQQEDQKGIRGERGGVGVTLLGKRAIRRGGRGWMLTMNSHGVEFSIARCVEEIVRDPNPMTCFSFSFFFHVLCIKQLLGTKTTCSASYSEEKTTSPLIHPAPGKKPSTQGSLV